MALITVILQQYPTTEDYHACTSMKVSSYSGHPLSKGPYGGCSSYRRDSMAILTVMQSCNLRLFFICSNFINPKKRARKGAFSDFYKLKITFRNSVANGVFQIIDVSRLSTEIIAPFIHHWTADPTFISGIEVVISFCTNCARKTEPRETVAIPQRQRQYPGG